MCGKRRKLCIEPANCTSYIQVSCQSHAFTSRKFVWKITSGKATMDSLGGTMTMKLPLTRKLVRVNRQAN